LRGPTLESFANIREQLPEVSVWDPLPILCPTPVCHAMQRSKPLLFDGDHLSAYANRILKPHFERYLDGVRT
jgi:hypothetical protein